MPIANPAPSACVTASLAHASSLHVQPVTPHAGSLFRVTILSTRSGVQPDEVSASVSGEPLHFHVVGDSLIAIAAVPIDSTKGVKIALRCNNDAPIVTRIHTQSGAYPLEKLTVAPQFSTPPDSALSARMSREAAQAATVSRESHNTPRLWNAPFAKPRATRITSAFGGGRIFNGEVTSRHMGTDFAGAVGEPVRAANRGIVRLIGAFYLGGNVVYIDHGEGLVTAYLHLSKQLVAIGDTVAQGAIIGRVGATGRVTGPHLHFIARYGQITVDPLTLFAQR
ncbi:MAG: M23 family metallopeptidase [Gemmatimonadaceae bacterium]